MVEVDGVEDLVGNAKIERSGDTVPQLIKTGILGPYDCLYPEGRSPPHCLVTLRAGP